MTPRLEIPRLLRPFAPGDWEAVDAMLSDPETVRHMHFATWTADRRRETTAFDADFEGNWARRHHYGITKAEYDIRG